MRYMLLFHARQSELLERSPEWAEEAAAFIARFDDELASTSELEWTEVLGAGANAVTVGPGGEPETGWVNSSGDPLSRIWVVRVDAAARAIALAHNLAGELDAWIEVRECLPSAQRP